MEGTNRTGRQLIKRTRLPPIRKTPKARLSLNSGRNAAGDYGGASSREEMRIIGSNNVSQLSMTKDDDSEASEHSCGHDHSKVDGTL